MFLKSARWILYTKDKYLCMPMNPHFKNKSTEVTLKDLIKKNDTLRKLSKENRLFWYNHLFGKKFFIKI